jgi:hypothetical protein
VAKAKERVEPHFGGRKREGGRKSRKPQVFKSADRPLRRATSSAPGLLAEMGRQARDRYRRGVLPPACQEPVTPLVMWTVYKHPKDYPGEYLTRKFVIAEDFYRPSNESISSRSLRDGRSVLRSLYPGLIQLKRPPTTNRMSWRCGYDARPSRFLSCHARRSSSPRSTLR